jgi:hypothetical protein
MNDLLRVCHTLGGATESAAIVLQIFTGADMDSCRDVAAWVAHDPHEEPLADPVDELARQVLRLRRFENALYDHATWESPGGRW